MSKYIFLSFAFDSVGDRPNKIYQFGALISWFQILFRQYRHFSHVAWHLINSNYRRVFVNRSHSMCRGDVRILLHVYQLVCTCEDQISDLGYLFVFHSDAVYAIIINASAQSNHNNFVCMLFYFFRSLFTYDCIIQQLCLCLYMFKLLELQFLFTSPLSS